MNFNQRSRLRSAFLIFLNKPDEGGGGGSAEPETLTDAKAALAAARKERDDAKTAQTTAEGQLAGVTKERDDAKAEVDAVKGQFTALTNAANAQKKQLEEAQSALTTASAQLVEAQKSLANANGNVERLEALCGVSGIDPKKAVKVTGANAPTGEGSSVDEFNARYAAAKSPAEKQAVLNDFAKAAKAGTVAPEES